MNAVFDGEPFASFLAAGSNYVMPLLSVSTPTPLMAEPNKEGRMQECPGCLRDKCGSCPTTPFCSVTGKKGAE